MTQVQTPSQDSIKYSLISIMANSLTAGSLYTYPIYSTSFQSKLNFTAQQVSTTASLGILTQYLSAAFWGSIADKHGPGRLSLISSILFFIGYTHLYYLLINATSSIDQPHSITDFDLGNGSAKLSTWIHVTVAYSFCGAATTASYFAALTASTKTFGSSGPGISVAGPSTLFGLSPLLLSFLGIKLFSNPNSNEEFNSSSYLGCLAILMTVVNLMGSIGLAHCKQISTEDTDSYFEPNERAPLLRSSLPLLENSPTSIQSTSIPEPTPKSLRSLVGSKANPEREVLEGTLEFLKNPEVWLLGIIILLSAGPAEMTISSIGLIVDSSYYENRSSKPIVMNFKAKQVQIISLTNTALRLLSGWASDRFCGPGSAPRLAIWVTGCLVYSSLCFSFANHPTFVTVLSTITGCFYGMIFTLAPSLVATVWSTSSFGRNYGIISYFSATGSFLFTFVFGILYNPSNPNSMRSIYLLSGFAELGSILFIFFLYRKYWIKPNF